MTVRNKQIQCKNEKSHIDNCGSLLRHLLDVEAGLAQKTSKAAFPRVNGLFSFDCVSPRRDLNLAIMWSRGVPYRLSTVLILPPPPPDWLTVQNLLWILFFSSFYFTLRCSWIPKINPLLFQQPPPAPSLPATYLTYLRVMILIPGAQDSTRRKKLRVKLILALKVLAWGASTF